MATHDEERTRPSTSAEQWGLAYPGLGMSADDSKNVVKEFTGIWPLKPDADMVAFTKALGPGGWIDPPGESFSENMMKLGLIRAARWFVAKTTPDNDGYTLFFVSQFDNTLEKYFDDFVLNGKPTWRRSGASASAARPVRTRRHTTSSSTSRAGRSRPWLCTTSTRASASPRSTRRLTGTRRRRSSSGRSPQGDGALEDKVDAFLKELAEPYEPVPRRHDRPDVGSELQYERTRNQRGGDAWQLDRPRALRGLVDSTVRRRRSAHATARSLTAADLEENVDDIQDNAVTPILLRYGRHIFFEFTDAARARAWLRSMFKRVNARREEHGTRFTVNIGFTHGGLKAIGLSQRSLDSFPEAFRVGMRGRAVLVGDVGRHAPEHWEGGLGGADIHAHGVDTHRFRAGARRGDADRSRRDGGDRRRRGSFRPGHEGARP